MGKNNDLLKLAVNYLPLKNIKLDPKNARAHSKKQIKQIAESIREFNFNVPILIDGKNKIIAGEGRYLASQELGRSEVPIIRLEHLTEAQARAFAIADNRLTENSVWNDQILAENLKELSELNLDFSLEITGFDMGEIDFRIEGLTISGPSDEEDEPVAIHPNPVSKLGDIWCLDEHRVLCGNSLESENYRRLLNGSKADVIFTDPPYNVKIDGHATGNGQTTHREFAMASGEMSSAEFTTFLKTVFHNIATHSHSGSIHYICMDWRHILELMTAGNEVYSELKNMCVWAKDNAGMGSFYRSQHELVFVYKNGSGLHKNNVQLGQYGRYRTNVWKYPGINTMRRQEEGDLLSIHPTVKPIALVSDALLDSSARGDRVLEPFLGSGSTLLAAEAVGRVCFGIEIDPLYVDASIRRWQKKTGKSAIKDNTGEDFNTLEAVNHE